MHLLQFVFRRPGSGGVALAWLALSVAACASGPAAIDRPRPMVVPTGARLQPDSARLDSVDVWANELDRVITEDPSFVVFTATVPQAAFPWETLEFREGDPDTVRVAIEAGSDALLSYQIYGFLHLMKRMDRLGEFFPDAAELQGFDLERFILARTADSWILGRAVYDTAPYPPLDELAYAYDRDYLDAMILHARPEEFEETREAWLEENAGRMEEYRSWFEETFNEEPPGPSGP